MSASPMISFVLKKDDDDDDDYDEDLVFPPLLSPRLLGSAVLRARWAAVVGET